MAGVLSSLFMIAVSLYFTGLFQNLPLTVLAATILSRFGNWLSSLLFMKHGNILELMDLP